MRENIRYGKPNSSDDEVINAAKMAAVHQDILNLTEGYDTDIAEGTKLSGGQRQRVAIARALIRQPSILILDEATSALDSHSALQISKTLDKLADGKTIIMITHKLASVKNFDEIFVVYKGRIHEKGDFENLMKQNGLFASMYKQQTRF